MTVFGAGHMIPTNKPEASLHIISRFIKSVTSFHNHGLKFQRLDEVFTPIFMSNSKIFDAQVFNDKFLKWTKKARKEATSLPQGSNLLTRNFKIFSSNQEVLRS